jgi:hypothetical protein
MFGEYFPVQVGHTILPHSPNDESGLCKRIVFVEIDAQSAEMSSWELRMEHTATFHIDSFWSLLIGCPSL